MVTAARATIERFFPLAGVVAVVLWVIGVLISESGEASRDDETAEGTLDWFTRNETEIAAGEITFAFGVLFFIWFLGSLRSTLVAHEPSAQLTAIGYASGMLAALGMLIQAAVLIQPSFVDEGDLSAEAAQTLAVLSDAMFGVVELTLAVALVAFGLAFLRTGALPKLLGWATLALAGILLIIPIGWIGMIFLMPLWVLVTSVLLFLRRGGEPAVAGPPAERL